MSTELVELPNTPSKDTQNAELCIKCLNMFRSGEDGHECRFDCRHMLFDSDSMHELSPDTCPVCAIIEFKASTNQEELSQILYSFRALKHRERVCLLKFYVSGTCWDMHPLQILPADSK